MSCENTYFGCQCMYSDCRFPLCPPLEMSEKSMAEQRKPIEERPLILQEPKAGEVHWTNNKGPDLLKLHFEKGMI